MKQSCSEYTSINTRTTQKKIPIIALIFVIVLSSSSSFLFHPNLGFQRVERKHTKKVTVPPPLVIMSTSESTIHEPLLPNDGNYESVERIQPPVRHDVRYTGWRCKCCPSSSPYWLTSLLCCKRQIQSRDNDDDEEGGEDTLISTGIVSHEHTHTPDNDDHNSSKLQLDERIIELQQCMKRALEHHSNDLELSKDFIEMMLEEDDDGGGDKEEEEEKELKKEENDDILGGDDAVEEEESIDGRERIKGKIQNEKDDHYYASHYLEQILAKREGDNEIDYSYHVMKGIPSRPFYKSLSMRIILFTHFCHSNNNDDTIQTDGDREEVFTHSLPIPRPLIDASKLGFSENQPLPTIAPFTASTTVTNVIHYMNKLRENGIFEYLGLRSTIGTITTTNHSTSNKSSTTANNNGNASDSSDNNKCNHHEYLNHIPSIAQLLKAANQPCKPKSNPPRLTVAGRARAKHAHRSISIADEDLYFGVCKGSTNEKSHAADAIVRTMICDAVWINVHVFGGVNVPILEIRVKEGYGARWSVGNSHDQASDQDDNDGACISNKTQKEITFRGFLEPHMSDGFEKKWRH